MVFAYKPPIKNTGLPGLSFLWGYYSGIQVEAHSGIVTFFSGPI
jgi:hypothetical protein